MLRLRNKNKWSVWVVLALVLMTACKPSIPKGIIDPDDMEDFLYDYHLSRAIAAQHQNNDSRDFNETMYYEAVLKKHGLTQAELDTSFISYYGHVERFAKIYQNVAKRLNEDAMELGASVGELGDFMVTSLSGDTANIWNETTSLLLLPQPGYNRATFELKADSSFRKGDTFQYNMKANYLFKAGMKDALLYAAIRYDNDSVSVHQVHCTVSGLVTLRIPANTNQVVKDIRTFIYLSPSREKDKNNMLFLEQIQLVRFHKQKTQDSEPDEQKPDSTQRAMTLRND